MAPCDYGRSTRRMLLFAASILAAAASICAVAASARITAAERIAADAAASAKENAASIQDNREITARIDERLQAINAGVQRIERQLVQERARQ